MSEQQRKRLLEVITSVWLAVATLWFLTSPSLETLAVLLSAIAAGLTLYAVRIRPVVPRDPKFIRSTHEPFHVKVALWGPVGCGKSWFINAFARALDTNYPNVIEGLKYEFFSYTEQHIGKEYRPESPLPTMGASSEYFGFERCRTSDSYEQAISSFQHRIVVQDDMGGRLINSLFEDAPYSPELTLLSLASADIVVVALDPTLTDTGFCTSTQYAEWVSRLFRVLEKTDPSRCRYYAVCIMKADRIEFSRSVHPHALVEALFGPGMVECLSIPDPEFIDVFTVSSFGFLPDRKTPNLNGERIYLRDPVAWKPYGVEFPIFWAFESIEKRTLNAMFCRTWWGRLWAKRRLKKYISYPHPTLE